MMLRYIVTSYGGNPDEIPKPWKLRYPGREKRPVHVSISIYGTLGTHYYVDIKEDDNAVLDVREPRENTTHWRTFWRHPQELCGIHINKKFGNPGDAKAFVEKQLERFPKKTHKIIWDYGKDYISKRWIQREGD